MKSTYMGFLSQRFFLVVFVVLALTLSFVIIPTVSAATNSSPLTVYVGLGDRGTSVTNLQTFLAENSAIYPEGLVTGYFGSLTEQAVIRFQKQYGIDPVGRVGPLTLGKINTIIVGGGWSSSFSDVSGPWIYSVTPAVSSNFATLTWSTNENATGKIFYNTSPVTMNEGDINSVGFGPTSGQTATNGNFARMFQQVTITGLQPNTVYYYVIVSTDLAGNVSVWNPNTTFRTLQ